MFNVLILLVVSIAIGFALRKCGRLRNIFSATTTLTILTLLFVFGSSIGSNESIISNLHYDGGKAAVIAVFGVVGSVLSTILYNKYQKNSGIRKKGGEV